MTEETDLDRIMAIMDASFDPHWGEAWTRRQVSDSLLLPTTFHHIADAESVSIKAAGFTLSRHVADEEELLLIAVRPELRGHGVGDSLLAALVNDAAKRGAEKLFLEMRANNPAVSLYKRHGFEPIGRRRDYYTLGDGSRLDAITFARDIRPSA